MMRKTLISLGAAAMTLATAAAWSQDASADAQQSPADAAKSSQTNSDDSIPDVVVTAQRRQESLQKAALSVSVVSGDEIRQRGLSNIGDVLSQTPNVMMQNNNRGQAVYIRGVGSTGDSQAGGDPAVNLSIDGVYQQQAVVALANTFDIKRVEVLRGPQGTLYGRNANAGSINVITNDPELGRSSGLAMLQAGNYNTFRTEAYANLPISDDMAARIAMASSRHDGYLSTGASAQDSISGRAKFLYQVSDALTVQLTADFAHEDGAPAATVPAPLSSSHSWNSNVTRGVQDVRMSRVYAQIDYDLGFATWSILPAYSYTHQYEDSMLLPVGAAAQDIQEKAGSGEMRLVSNTDSAIKWVGGLYSYNAKNTPKLDPHITIDAPHNEVTSFPTDVQSGVMAKSYAAYGQATRPLTTSFRFIGGLRATLDRKGFDYKTETDTDIYVDGPSYRKDFYSTTYLAGVEYDLAPESMLYGDVGNGLKAGGFNSDGTSYDPEKITAYEIGSKTRFLKGRLQVNGSAYYYDYSDYQARLPYPDSTGVGGFTQKVQNAATATIYGLELETAVAITPHDRLDFTVAYLHANFDTFRYTDATGDVDRSGQVLPMAPKWSSQVGYNHIWSFTSGSALTARIDAHLASGYDSSIDAATDDWQPGYTRTDATLSFDSADGRWNLRTDIRNIEDKAQRQFALAPTAALSALEVSNPRTFGMGVTMRF